MNKVAVNMSSDDELSVSEEDLDSAVESEGDVVVDEELSASEHVIKRPRISDFAVKLRELSSPAKNLESDRTQACLTAALAGAMAEYVERELDQEEVALYDVQISSITSVLNKKLTSLKQSDFLGVLKRARKAFRATKDADCDKAAAAVFQSPQASKDLIFYTLIKVYIGLLSDLLSANPELTYFITKKDIPVALAPRLAMVQPRKTLDGEKMRPPISTLRGPVISDLVRSANIGMAHALIACRNIDIDQQLDPNAKRFAPPQTRTGQPGTFNPYVERKTALAGFIYNHSQGENAKRIMQGVQRSIENQPALRNIVFRGIPYKPDLHIGDLEMRLSPTEAPTSALISSSDIKKLRDHRGIEIKDLNFGPAEAFETFQGNKFDNEHHSKIYNDAISGILDHLQISASAPPLLESSRLQKLIKSGFDCTTVDECSAFYREIYKRLLVALEAALRDFPGTNTETFRSDAITFERILSEKVNSAVRAIVSDSDVKNSSSAKLACELILDTKLNSPVGLADVVLGIKQDVLHPKWPGGQARGEEKLSADIDEEELAKRFKTSVTNEREKAWFPKEIHLKPSEYSDEYIKSRLAFSAHGLMDRFKTPLFADKFAKNEAEAVEWMSMYGSRLAMTDAGVAQKASELTKMSKMFTDAQTRAKLGIPLPGPDTFSSNLKKKKQAQLEWAANLIKFITAHPNYDSLAKALGGSKYVDPFFLALGLEFVSITDEINVPLALTFSKAEVVGEAADPEAIQTGKAERASARAEEGSEGEGAPTGRRAAGFINSEAVEAANKFLTSMIDDVKSWLNLKGEFYVHSAPGILKNIYEFERKSHYVPNPDIQKKNKALHDKFIITSKDEDGKDIGPAQYLIGYFKGRVKRSYGATIGRRNRSLLTSLLKENAAIGKYPSNMQEFAEAVGAFADPSRLDKRSHGEHDNVQKYDTVSLHLERAMSAVGDVQKDLPGLTQTYIREFDTRKSIILTLSPQLREFIYPFKRGSISYDKSPFSDQNVEARLMGILSGSSDEAFKKVPKEEQPYSDIKSISGFAISKKNDLIRVFNNSVSELVDYSVAEFITNSFNEIYGSLSDKDIKDFSKIGDAIKQVFKNKHARWGAKHVYGTDGSLFNAEVDKIIGMLVVAEQLEEEVVAEKEMEKFTLAPANYSELIALSTRILASGVPTGSKSYVTSAVNALLTQIQVWRDRYNDSDAGKEKEVLKHVPDILEEAGVAPEQLSDEDIVRHIGFYIQARGLDGDIDSDGRKILIRNMKSQDFYKLGDIIDNLAVLEKRLKSTFDKLQSDTTEEEWQDEIAQYKVNFVPPQVGASNKDRMLANLSMHAGRLLSNLGKPHKAEATLSRSNPDDRIKLQAFDEFKQNGILFAKAISEIPSKMYRSVNESRLPDLVNDIKTLADNLAGGLDETILKQYARVTIINDVLPELRREYNIDLSSITSGLKSFNPSTLRTTTLTQNLTADIAAVKDAAADVLRTIANNRSSLLAAFVAIPGANAAAYDAEFEANSGVILSAISGASDKAFQKATGDTLKRAENELRALQSEFSKSRVSVESFEKFSLISSANMVRRFASQLGVDVTSVLSNLKEYTGESEQVDQSSEDSDKALLQSMAESMYSLYTSLNDSVQYRALDVNERKLIQERLGKIVFALKEPSVRVTDVEKAIEASELIQKMLENDQYAIRALSADIGQLVAAIQRGVSVSAASLPQTSAVTTPAVSQEFNEFDEPDVEVAIEQFNEFDEPDVEVSSGLSQIADKLVNDLLHGKLKSSNEFGALSDTEKSIVATNIAAIAAALRSPQVHIIDDEALSSVIDTVNTAIDDADFAIHLFGGPMIDSIISLIEDSTGIRVSGVKPGRIEPQAVPTKQQLPQPKFQEVDVSLDELIESVPAEQQQQQQQSVPEQQSDVSDDMIVSDDRVSSMIESLNELASNTKLTGPIWNTVKANAADLARLVSGSIRVVNEDLLDVLVTQIVDVIDGGDETEIADMLTGNGFNRVKARLNSSIVRQASAQSDSYLLRVAESTNGEWYRF